VIIEQRQEDFSEKRGTLGKRSVQCDEDILAYLDGGEKSFGSQEAVGKKSWSTIPAIETTINVEREGKTAQGRVREKDNTAGERGVKEKFSSCVRGREVCL